MIPAVDFQLVTQFAMKHSVLSKADILEILQENRSQLLIYGVRSIGLFGSFARDEQSPDSDIDILVEFEPTKKSFDNFIGLSFFLEELFDRRIELVTPEALSPYIGPRILAETEYVPLAA